MNIATATAPAAPVAIARLNECDSTLKNAWKHLVGIAFLSLIESGLVVVFG